MITEENNTAEQRLIQLFVDSPFPKLAGWAAFAPGSRNPTEGAIGVSLVVGSTRAGEVTRSIARPDVDAHVGYNGAAKGFALDLPAVAEFAVLSSVSVRLVAMSANAASIEVDLPQPSSLLGSPMRLVQSDDLRLADAWMATSRRLALRLSCRTTLPTLRFIQPDPITAGQTVLLTATLRGNNDIAIAEVELLNPFLPVLMLVLDETGRITDGDLIPFPSLVSGGVHAAEGRLAPAGLFGLAGVQAVSAPLVRTLAERRIAGNTTIQQRLVTFDREMMTAAHEPLCDPIFVEAASWFGSQVTTDGDLALLDTNIITMNYSTRSVPTLSALIKSLTPAEHTREHTAVPYLVQHPEGETWLISPPADSGSLVKIRSGSEEQCYSTDDPLAILFPPRKTVMQPSLLFRRSIDSEERPRNDTVLEPIDVLIGSSSNTGCPEALLQSISEQIGFNSGEVLYSVTTVEAQRAALPALEALLPGRYRIVFHSQKMSRVREFQAVAGLCSSQHLMMLDPETILHDRHTFATISSCSTGWGMMSPLLVAPAAGSAKFANAGLFLRSIDFRGSSRLTFETLNALDVLPNTYAVAAVPLCAVAMRRDFLCALPVADTPWDTSIQDELRLGLAVMRAGHLVGVTSDVSVTTLRSDLPSENMQAKLPVSEIASWFNQFIQHTTGLQRL